jgi:hypothetical protein
MKLNLALCFAFLTLIFAGEARAWPHDHCGPDCYCCPPPNMGGHMTNAALQGVHFGTKPPVRIPITPIVIHR